MLATERRRDPGAGARSPSSGAAARVASEASGTLDLAVAGNLLVDDIVYQDGATRMAQPGGATLYAALGASLWGIRVGIVSVVGDDYPEHMLDGLTARGIDLAGLRRLDRPGLRTWLLYEGRRRHVVHRLDGPTHAQVSPTAADLAAVRARAVHLAPMPFEVQRDLALALALRRPTAGGPTEHDAGVSLDPYELLTAENLGAWQKILTGVDDFLLSEDEMMIAGGLETPRPILAELCDPAPRTSAFGEAPRPSPAAPSARCDTQRAPGPHRIFYKRGARGGIAYDHRARRFLEWRARARAVVDPTGAGDAFAGGVLAGRLLGDPLSRALERGVVSAAFAVEGVGAEELLAASPESANHRLGKGS